MTSLIANKDYELKLPKPHLSYSQISLYLECPQRYYQTYVLDAPRVTSPAMVEGTIMGLLLEASSRNYCRRGRHFQLDTALWKHEALCRDCPRLLADQLDHAIERGSVFLKQLWCINNGKKQHPNLSPCRLKINGSVRLGIELQTTVVIAGVPVVVIPDILEKERLWDYKVGGSRFFYDPHKSLQLSLYAHAFQYEKVGFILFEKITKLLRWLPSQRDLKQNAKAVSTIVADVAHKISVGLQHKDPENSGQFEKCVKEDNFFCCAKWCQFHGQCYPTTN